MKLSGIGKFLGGYAGELRALVAVVSTVLPALGIGRQDKEKIEAILENLQEAADRVEAAAPSANQPKVVVKKSDVEAAVKAALPAVVAAELKRLGITEAKETAK